MAETVRAYVLCQDEVVNRENVEYYTVGTSAGPISAGAWEWGTIMIDTVVPVASTLTLTVQFSNDGINWYPGYIHDLTAAANKWVLAANLVLAAGATIQQVIGLSCPTPYLRVGAISGAAADCTINRMELTLIT